MMEQERQLDERKSVILKAVVTDYVITAQPVGSQYLARRYRFGVKPATIRNELAEMADMGYLRQPHTSAGRIPSDLGYRFYVDRLMEPVAVPSKQARQAKRDLVEQCCEIEELIYQSCRILAGLTRYTSLATRPSSDRSTLRFVSLSRLSRHKLLLVLVMSSGTVEHRILDVNQTVTDAQVLEISNMLSSGIIGKSIQELSALDPEAPENIPHPTVYIAAISGIRELVGSNVDDDVCIDGTSYILQQPEFKDVDRLERVMRLLEERKALFRMLSTTLLGPGTSVVIGKENPVSDMHDASFVAAKYYVRDRACRTIGVLGPTRMDYRRALAAVNLMAQSLSELLTSLSVD